jgi:hypothetical protein
LGTAEQIRQAIRSQPFRPFDLKLVDGTVYTVDHPDYLLVPPGRRPHEVISYTPLDANADEFETHWIDLGLIAEVITPSRDHATPSSASG